MKSCLQSNGSLKKLKLYQPFYELLAHDSNVTQTLQELTRGPIALISSYDPQTSNPIALDPLTTVVP